MTDAQYNELLDFSDQLVDLLDEAPEDGEDDSEFLRRVRGIAQELMNLSQEK